MPAVVTQPAFTCELCETPLLRCTRRCYRCSAPTLAAQLAGIRDQLRYGSEPTPDELAAELSALDESEERAEAQRDYDELNDYRQQETDR